MKVGTLYHPKPFYLRNSCAAMIGFMYNIGQKVQLIFNPSPDDMRHFCLVFYLLSPEESVYNSIARELVFYL